MKSVQVVSICMWTWVAVNAIAGVPEDSAHWDMSLQGEWGFRLDPNNEGTDKGWFHVDLPEMVHLPGSTDENKKGTFNTRKPNYDHLSRVYEYVGPAWYQREIEIPTDWKRKRIDLFLERCHWETRVWLDGREIGTQDSLCVPHVYELGGEVTPGKHRLTIRVDNSHKYDMGADAHSTSEQTQSNWNGIVGRIELHAKDPVWIDDLQVYPAAGTKHAWIKAVVKNATGEPVTGNIVLSVVSKGDGTPVALQEVPVPLSEASATIGGDLDLSKWFKAWDEFSPSLYCVIATLHMKTTDGSRSFCDQRTTNFGMRDLAIADGKQFTLNGRQMYLRGTLECCIFPKTGYPPTDVESWRRIFGIAKSYGLNHMRFHSWCPPEAAFTAADETGFLLHVEAPQWVFNVGQDGPRDRFIEQEVRRILTVYGNHPSFGMLCMGNELRGDASFLQTLVKMAKQMDSRHFYTSATAWSFGKNDDYNVAVIRGLHGPGTDFDFREVDAKSRVPIISHEIGQWAVYPNLAEIPKYTGPLHARNLELIRDDLAAKGMLDQAAEFTRESGLLSVLVTV